MLGTLVDPKMEAFLVKFLIKVYLIISPEVSSFHKNNPNLLRS